MHIEPLLIGQALCAGRAVLRTLPGSHFMGFGGERARGAGA